MNTHRLAVLLLATSLAALAPPAPAASLKELPAVAYPVTSVDHQGNLVTRGTTALNVRRMLGLPARTLSDDTWVYYGYEADFEPANVEGCDTLVLTFAEGRVTDIKLVNQRTVRLLASHARFETSGLAQTKK